jgi:hypothetical protein
MEAIVEFDLPTGLAGRLCPHLTVHFYEPGEYFLVATGLSAYALVYRQLLKPELSAEIASEREAHQVAFHRGIYFIPRSGDSIQAIRPLRRWVGQCYIQAMPGTGL